MPANGVSTNGTYGNRLGSVEVDAVKEIKLLPYEELGLTGLDYTAGVVVDDTIQNLYGRQAIKIFKDMRDNEPVCGATLFAIDMLVRQAEWTVSPFEDDNAEDEANAKFIEECMDDMSHTFNDYVSEAFSMLPFGWAYHEIVYKRRTGPNKEAKLSSKFDDGKIGWRKLPLRGQESLDRWVFDESGGVRAMIQQAPPDYAIRIIPIEKALLNRTSVHKNNPEGRSVFRSAYRPWTFKKRIEEIEGIGIERDLAGLPIAYVDPEILMESATTEQVAMRQRVEKIVKNIRRDTQEGIVWPMAYDREGNQIYKFELLTTGGSRQFDTSSIIQRYEQRIAMTVLADFILLGHEAVGSFALSDSKTNLFAVALGTWLDRIADVFNRYAIPRLFDINNMPLDRLPKIVHSDIEVPDLAGMAALITALAGAGMPLFPDEELEEWIRRTAKWPEKNENSPEVAPGQEAMALVQGKPPKPNTQPSGNQDNAPQGQGQQPEPGQGA